MKHPTLHALEISFHVWPFWWRLDCFYDRRSRIAYVYVGPFALKVWRP